MKDRDNNIIYLDYNATTPISPEVAEVMKPFLESYFGNPSSSHVFGMKTKMAVENARKQVCELLNCELDELIFTSGGSESNNYSIKGIAYANRHRGNHLITSAIEHPATLEVYKFLEREGFRITIVGVDEFGMVNPEDIEKAITPDTILISIMHANNEVGTIQPIKAISKIAKQHDIFLHCDAAQSIGKISVDVKDLDVDLLSVAGHKFYAPKGIGALYIRRGVKLEKLIHGANHESDLRAGTENVLEIVGIGQAAHIVKQDLEELHDRYKYLRDLLCDNIISHISDFKINGHPEQSLPNTLNISFPGIEANTLLDEMEEVAASAGAACHSDDINISYVLEAMGIPVDIAMGTIRLSVGKFTTDEEILKASKIIVDSVNKLKNDVDQICDSSSISSDEIKLTHYTHGLGCACKIRPQYLERVLKSVPIFPDPNVIVGNSHSDDASVFKIDNNTAIVQSLDFFTPIVDDPYEFGQIAAANALSDIYAMGAQPLFAQNIVGFPDHRLPMDVLTQILKGASDKASEAGISILGGHTVEDTEPKFGMVVSGKIHPDKILSNDKAKDNHVLILTKPLGLGILSTAVKRGIVDNDKAKEISQIMATLNKRAAEIMVNYDISTCTDITGFGLLGHLYEITSASELGAEIYLSKVPFISGAYDCAISGIIPGGSKNNLKHIEDKVDFSNEISNVHRLLLCDAQTSGGLLIAVSSNDKEKLLSELLDNGMNASIIGSLTKGKGKISILK